jgi:hypothetical protein
MRWSHDPVAGKMAFDLHDPWSMVRNDAIVGMEEIVFPRRCEPFRVKQKMVPNRQQVPRDIQPPQIAIIVGRVAEDIVLPVPCPVADPDSPHEMRSTGSID